MRLLKIDKRDRLFSKLIRHRAGWKCQHCLLYFPEDMRQGLHCSHFISRKYKQTKWHPDNAASHCAKCHAILQDHPGDMRDFFFEYLGEERYDAVRLLSVSKDKIIKPELEEIYDHLTAEWERVKDLEEPEFTAWERVSDLQNPD